MIFMASKVECDLCKKVFDYKKTSFVKVYRRTEVDKGDFDYGFDICDDCLEKIKNKTESKEEK